MLQNSIRIIVRNVCNAYSRLLSKKYLLENVKTMAMAPMAPVADEGAAGKPVAEENNAGFIDSSFIIGTTDVVERFFSECKNVLTDKRSGMTPFVFESIMFLKANAALWNAEDVAQAILMQTDDTKEAADYALVFKDYLESLESEENE